MTKREMVKAIAKHVKGNPNQIAKAIDYAVSDKRRERILEVYEFFTNHHENADFCLYLLSGIQFNNSKHDTY